MFLLHQKKYGIDLFFCSRKEKKEKKIIKPNKVKRKIKEFFVLKYYIQRIY